MFTFDQQPAEPLHDVGPRRRGRKPLPAAQRASTTVTISLQPADMARLKQLAAATNVKSAVLARDAVLHILEHGFVVLVSK